jgi:hypothetical protein
MTIELCRGMASARHFRFYGLQNSSECWATNDTTSPFELGTSDGCNLTCFGDASQQCGGVDAVAVYDIGKFFQCSNCCI